MSPTRSPSRKDFTVLLNIDPLLSPDLLHALRSMGHRQDIAIVDANFPADPARGRVIRLDGVSATAVLNAVLSVMPLEVEEEASAWRMIAEGDPGNILPIFAEFSDIVAAASPGSVVTAIEPVEFKQRAGDAYAIVITGERRLYGGAIVRKGVVPPS
jgi:L-fucose mutarotase